MIRKQYPREALFRSVGEWYVVQACFFAAVLILVAGEYFFMNATLVYASVIFLFGLGAIYTQDALYIHRFQKNLKILRPYKVKSSAIPFTDKYVLLGKGFEWLPKHTQRLKDTQLPANERFIKHSKLYLKVRNFALKHKDSNNFKYLIKALNSNSFFNPFKPIPDIGGRPEIHGIEPAEIEYLWPSEKRNGHTGWFGTTGSGKTRCAEYVITHDIRAGAKHLKNDGNVVIFFDPKGDGELLRRMIIECMVAGRMDDFYMIHLGFPELSCSYNPIGDFQKITEVAGRSTNQLADGGNSAAFKEFSWRFVNINAQALAAIGEEVSFEVLQHYISYTEDLLEKYLKVQKSMDDESFDDLIAEYVSELDKMKVQRSSRSERALAIIELAKDHLHDVEDGIMKGLVSALEYDRTYYDKLVASLLPFLDKMTTGDVKDIFSPSTNSKKKRMRWRDVIARRGVVYIGLDALTDPVIASSFASSCISDLTSLTGEIYKKGSITDEPDFLKGKNIPILLHLDEFNELVSGEEIIQILNKARGAGVQAHLYTQTLKDIEAKLGNEAKASQILGNLQNLVMMRVREVKTAELLTTQLPKVEVSSVTGVGGTSDDGSLVDFSTNNSDRDTTKEVPMIEPADVIALPIGQAFLLNDGGKLKKLRFPLIEDDSGFVLPDKVESMISKMKSDYSSGEDWMKNGKR